jgi:hypothetical protein
MLFSRCMTSCDEPRRSRSMNAKQVAASSSVLISLGYSYPGILGGADEDGMECVDESVDMEFRDAMDGTGEFERGNIIVTGVRFGWGEGDTNAVVEGPGEGPTGRCTGGVRGGTYRVAFRSNSLSIASGRSSILKIWR